LAGLAFLCGIRHGNYRLHHLSRHLTTSRSLERRLKAGPQHEQAWSQKTIVSLAFVAFLQSSHYLRSITALAGRL